MAHYNKVPWLLARLDQPGVAGEFVRQYNAVGEDAHEPVTLAFLRPGSPLRSCIDRMHPDGSGLDEELRLQVHSLRDISIDDAHAEGPHAAMGRISATSRSSTWARLSSTLCLNQNLHDAARITRACDLDLQELWNCWSSVLKPQALARIIVG